jgi:hypothetical protein
MKEYANLPVGWRVGGVARKSVVGQRVKCPPSGFSFGGVAEWARPFGGLADWSGKVLWSKELDVRQAVFHLAEWAQGKDEG